MRSTSSKVGAGAMLHDFVNVDYGKTVRDVPTTVTVEIRLEGEAVAITLTLEDMASVLAPSLQQALVGPLEKFRRVPKGVCVKEPTLRPPD